MFEELRKLITQYRLLIEERAAFERDEDTRDPDEIDDETDNVKNAIVDCVDNNF